MIAHTKVILHRIVDRILCYQSLRFISVFDGPISELSENTAYMSRKFPTVSTIISKTMPVENVMILRKWQEKMRKQMGDKEFNEHITRELIYVYIYIYKFGILILIFFIF